MENNNKMKSVKAKPVDGARDFNKSKMKLHYVYKVECCVGTSSTTQQYCEILTSNKSSLRWFPPSTSNYNWKISIIQ